jgi:protein O-mannosyl-transferase
MGRRSKRKRAVGVAAAAPAVVKSPQANPPATAEPVPIRQAPLLIPSRWPARLRDHSELGIGLFLFVAALAVFGRSAGFDFVAYDDDAYVYDNRHVRGGLTLEGIAWAFTHVHAANWHPLTTLSHMLDCSLYGKWGGGHHLTSVLLHAVSCVVLFLALRQLTGAVWRSGFVAALFCVHPLHVESVAWISERKDVLSGLFFGLTLWAYAGYAQRPFSWGRYLGVIAIFGLGLLCKPMLVTLPFVLLLLDYWPLGRWQVAGNSDPCNSQRPALCAPLPASRLILEKLPLLALSAASCVLTYLVQRGAESIAEGAPLEMRVQTVLLAYTGYLTKTVWPVGLALPYPPQRDPAVLAATLCFLLLAAISVLVIILRRRMPWLAVGWLWYAGMLFPVSGIVMIGDQAMADRYSYLPLIGIFVALVWAVDDLWGSEWLVRWNGNPPHGARAKLGLATAMTLLLLLAATSYRQLGNWRDTEALFRNALAVTKDNCQAHTNLGIALWKQGPEMRNEAIAHFRESLRIKPTDYHALNNYGSILEKQGDYRGAIEQYRASLRAKSNYALAHNNLGSALLVLRRANEAEAEFREALRLNPEDEDAENKLGMALAIQKRSGEAIPHYRRALDLAPQEAQPRMNLGLALVAEGAVTEGIKECQAALAMMPNDVDGRYQLAKIYRANGNLPQARNEWQEVLRRNPRHPGAAKELGKALLEAGDGQQALPLLRIALSADPNDLETRRYLAFGDLLALRPREAVNGFREILRRDPNNRDAQNSLAWIEATHTDAAIRNGKEALELAQKVVSSRPSEIPNWLDTLAAAYAETGKFQEAVETAGKAKAAAQRGNDPALAGAIDARLKLYESQKPYREARP